MKSAYDRIEVGVGLLGLLSVPFIFWKTQHLVEVNVEDVFKWSGILLLGQGLLRDIVLLTFYRELLKQKNGENKKGLWICVESTLGALFVLIYLLLLGAGAELKFEFSPGVWVLGIVCCWLFGYATREFILELKRDPNHLNLVVGI